MPHKKSHRYLFGNGEIAELIFCLFPWSTLTGADQLLMPVGVFR